MLKNNLKFFLDGIRKAKKQKRNRLFTDLINKEMLGLEIGGSHNPIITKRDDWNIKTMDYTNTEELKKINKSNPSVNYELINDVDFVLIDGDFQKTLTSYGDYKFDYIISSHVIEHTTCVISYCKMLETHLKEDGIAIMAIPNKLTCFDFFKPLSTTADAISNFENKKSKHSNHKIRTMLINNIHINGKDGWEGYQSINGYRFQNDLESLNEKYEELVDQNKESYVDIHEWYFIPSSFELILFELFHLGYINVKISKIIESTGEFFVYLSNNVSKNEVDTNSIENKRLYLNKKIINQLYLAYKKVLFPSAFFKLKYYAINKLKSI